MIRKLFFLFALLLACQMFAQEDIEVINIENKAVQDYMADAASTYANNADYRMSVITKYNDSNKYGKKLYWPQGKEVTWTSSVPVEEISEIRITVSGNKYFRDSVTHNPDDNSATSFVIRNMLPNRTYYYKVEEFHNDGTITEMANGVFRTIGQVRMIQVRNSTNVRDIGGWNTQYGVPVKYGRLYRSASLEKTTANGRHDFVDNLGVVAELDLRHEVKKTSSCLGPDINYLRMDHGAYLSGMQKKSRVYVRDLNWIIDRLYEGKNVDWHCAIGCDRCGTLSFLIEGLLGLSELDLCRDYELSTFSLSKNNKRQRSPLKSMISYIKTFGPDDDLAQCFFNYWVSIGMRRGDLNYFLYEMLGIFNIVKITAKYGAPNAKTKDN